MNTLFKLLSYLVSAASIGGFVYFLDLSVSQFATMLVAGITALTVGKKVEKNLDNKILILSNDMVAKSKYIERKSLIKTTGLAAGLAYLGQYEIASAVGCLAAGKLYTGWHNTRKVKEKNTTQL